MGAVNAPGIYQYIKGYKVKDYIELAGGYTKQADRYSTYVTHLNGSSEKTKIFKSSANVYDSSVIQVAEKDIVEPFNLTQYAMNLTSIYTDIMQAYALISIIGNN